MFFSLPEDPVDTAETNALLRTADGELPNFPEITGEKCYAGVGRLALDYETGVWDMEEKIRRKYDMFLTDCNSSNLITIN